MADEVLIGDRGAVRLLTLNRPDKRNAINLALTHALIDALRDAQQSSYIGCLVLTGNGPAFCAGADLGEFHQLAGDDTALVDERARLTMTLHGLFPELSMPTIAAVNGHAMGGGAGLAIACDITIAAEDARLGYPEVKRGVVPAIVMANLVRVVGRKKAFELVATGEPITAAEARAIGMVNTVLPADQVLPAALALAERIAANSREAVARTKALFYRAADVSFADALDAGRVANQQMRKLRVS